MDPEDRSFTVTRFTHVGKPQQKFGDEGGKGRYISREPASAARKAARVIFRDAKSQDKSKAIYLEVRETTSGSSSRLFTYKATNKKVNEQLRLGRGKTITIKNRVDIKSVPSKHFKGGEQSDDLETRSRPFEDVASEYDIILESIKEHVQRIQGVVGDKTIRADSDGTIKTKENDDWNELDDTDMSTVENSVDRIYEDMMTFFSKLSAYKEADRREGQAIIERYPAFFDKLTELLKTSIEKRKAAKVTFRSLDEDSAQDGYYYITNHWLDSSANRRAFLEALEKNE